MRSVKDSALFWKPGTDQVTVVPLGEDPGRKDYPYSGLGCYTHIQEMPPAQRKTIAFINAMTLIIRDKCDPMAVHEAFLELEEYQDGCPDDMPGMNREFIRGEPYED